MIHLDSAILWIFGLLLGVIGTVAWWGFRRMVAGQDAMAKQLAELTVSLAVVCGNVTQSGQWQVQHEEKDVLRHASNVKETYELRDMLQSVLDRELNRAAPHG